jgi:uncharacterized membrane protein
MKYKFRSAHNQSMKKIILILIFAMFLSISTWGQTENTSGQKQVILINNKLLIGKWRSEIDAKYMLLFKKNRFIEL